MLINLLLKGYLYDPSQYPQYAEDVTNKEIDAQSYQQWRNQAWFEIKQLYWDETTLEKYNKKYNKKYGG